jgi:uncharacterized membrane protein YfcA
MEIILFGLIIIIVGAFASFASGLFGIGGGVILVPTFVIIFEHFGHTAIGAHTAIGTSLAIIIPNAILSVRKQNQLGNIDLHFFKKWAIGLIPGIICGGILMFFVSGLILKILFLILLLISLATLIFKKEEKASSEVLPEPKFSLVFLGSYILSGFSVLLGIGGGSFVVPYCNSVLKFPMKKAIATSSLTGLFIGIGGTALAMASGLVQPPNVDYSIGYVNIVCFFLVLPFCLWLPPKGVAFSNKISEKKNKLLFIGLLIICILMILSKII